MNEEKMARVGPQHQKKSGTKKRLPTHDFALLLELSIDEIGKKRGISAVSNTKRVGHTAFRYLQK
jgi:hypothetical protein